MFCHRGPFLLFTHLTTQKIKVLKKKKKCPECIILCITLYYLVSECIILYHLVSECIILHHVTYFYHTWQSYDLRFQRYGSQQTKVFVILDHFLSFYPVTTKKIRTLKKQKQKQKETPADIITLVYHKWQSNAILFLSCSWNIWHMSDVFYFFHFGIFFTPLPP